MTQPSDYNEYPIWLVHPHYKPATTGGIDPKTGRTGSGTPIQNPPVTALDSAQEDYYSAMGYERAGKINPNAWIQAHSDAPPENYEPAQYPKWVNGVLVNSAEEEGALDNQPVPEIQPDPTLDQPAGPSSADVASLLARLEAQQREIDELRATKASPSETPSDRAKRAWETRRANQAQSEARA